MGKRNMGKSPVCHVCNRTVAAHSEVDLIICKGHPKIKRLCLKCDIEFLATGKFERLCSKCRRENSAVSRQMGLSVKGPGAKHGKQGSE